MMYTSFSPKSDTRSHIIRPLLLYSSSFVIDRTDVNYMAISSNIAIKGSKGGPEKYDIFMKFGSPPTPFDYDQRSTLTASESYVGSVLYR